MSHISRIERGIFLPRPRLRAVLAELLELDIDAFEVAAAESGGSTKSAGSPA
jgi:hypothetical protein